MTFGLSHPQRHYIASVFEFRNQFQLEEDEKKEQAPTLVILFRL